MTPSEKSGASEGPRAPSPMAPANATAGPESSRAVGGAPARGVEQGALAGARIAPAQRPWFDRWWIIVPALVLLYPLGLVLVMKRPTPFWRRAASAILALPAFVLVVLVLLRPYWEFDGAMKRFRLDFSAGSRQFARVEKHRESQKSQGTAVPAPSSEFLALSWPHFRGPNRDGIVPDGIIETDWTANPPRERWRQPVGEGYSSFSIGGGRAFTLEQRRDNEVIVCYDLASGREIWTHAYPAYFREGLGGDGPRATPTLHDGMVYSLGAEGDMVCVRQADGGLVWRREILGEFGAQNLQWAMSASPLIEGDKVIVTNSGTPGPSIFALDKRTGKTIWQAEVGQQSYSSPVPAVLAGRRQILNLAGMYLNGIDPVDGALLWRFAFGTSIQISVANPLVLEGDRVFVAAGYGKGAAMVKIESGDGALTATELWANVRMKNKFSTSVVHDGHIYGLDEDILACLDADTGERKWKGGRYGYGSLLAVGDHLLVLGEDGTLVLLMATSERHTEIASLRILEHDKVWNNHVLVGGMLLARNHREMVCYDLRPKAPTLARP